MLQALIACPATMHMGMGHGTLAGASGLLNLQPLHWLPSGNRLQHNEFHVGHIVHA